MNQFIYICTPLKNKIFKLTSIIVQALSVHEVLQNVALLLEILRFAQHRDQLLHLGVGKVCLAGQSMTHRRQNQLGHCIRAVSHKVGGGTPHTHTHTYQTHIDKYGMDNI